MLETHLQDLKKKNEKIFFIDDDPFYLALLKMTLQKIPFEIMFFNSYPNFFAYLNDRQETKIKALFCDRYFHNQDILLSPFLPKWKRLYFHIPLIINTHSTAPHKFKNESWPLFIDKNEINFDNILSIIKIAKKISQEKQKRVK